MDFGRKVTDNLLIHQENFIFVRRYNGAMARNNLLTEELNYIGGSKTPTHLHLCVYTPAGVESHDGDTLDDVLPYFKEGAMHWMQIHGLKDTEEVQKVCQHFHIGFLTEQDILNSLHLTKIEEHDAYNVVILKLLTSSGDDAYIPQQLCLVQGGNFLLTFTENDTDFFDEIYTALENNVLNIRNRSSDYLLSVILNSVMASFMSILSDMEDKLEDLEERLLTPEMSDPTIGDLHVYRGNFRLIKKCVLPLKEEITKLLHSENASLLHKANRPFFSDVNDHLKFVLQTLEGCRDLLGALVDMILSSNDRHMNNIMKQLTVVSTIFIPLTFLAGIWGMNFRVMPELDWKYGYVYAWVLMLLIAIGICVYFRRKKWY